MSQTIQFPSPDTNSAVPIMRENEFKRIINALENDEDLLITGVPGSGRHILIQQASRQAYVKVLKIDCIQAINKETFIKQLCQGIIHTFKGEEALNRIQKWHINIAKNLFDLNFDANNRLQLGLAQSQNKLTGHEKDKFLFQAFGVLIKLPQELAEALKQRIVLILENFSHIRSWDRKDHIWENFLKNTINKQQLVSYVVVATISEVNIKTGVDENNQSTVVHINLSPLKEDSLICWLNKRELSFNEEGLKLFLNTVEGHLGDTQTLVRRLEATYAPNEQIGTEQVQKVVDDLLKDLSVVFESLLLLLPPSQVQVLECLALNPTETPFSRQYTQKHNLLRGGSLQSAILGLQEKGLLYNSEEKYRITLPLLTQWIKKRLKQDDN
ncbi:ATP-binding protein [Calothrix sp. NIES-2098]|uniref:ATP-binding protein n=1 Tax=Calothrix sp. NIES-2098 TaxID=1954171 RepID=UPI000B605820|nr:hypothetical protein NIES2098_74400 [Calothrix sp. NIES-2098]